MVAEAVVAGTFEAVIEGTVEAVIEGTVEAVIEGTVEAVIEGTVEAVIEGTVEAVIEVTVKAVIERTVEAVVDTIADTDEGITIVPEAVVAWGSVAVSAAIAIAIRLYFIGSACLASCFENEFALVTSVAAEPYMIQTSVLL